ncbi:MAG TPA: hypothetical protein VJ726_06060 [Candidatus Limnocylindria bacterium]|nr:hypothetical protein [Candidatus Limnocylindria bacterium]
MARRNRTRSRSRRETTASRRATSPRAPEREVAPRQSGYRARGSVPRVGYSRAAGAPSAALERESLVERANVARDFRRLGLTIAIAMVLLIGLGLLQGALLGR